MRTQQVAPFFCWDTLWHMGHMYLPFIYTSGYGTRVIHTVTKSKSIISIVSLLPSLNVQYLHPLVVALLTPFLPALNSSPHAEIEIPLAHVTIPLCTCCNTYPLAFFQSALHRIAMDPPLTSALSQKNRNISSLITLKITPLPVWKQRALLPLSISLSILVL